MKFYHKSKKLKRTYARIIKRIIVEKLYIKIHYFEFQNKQTPILKLHLILYFYILFYDCVFL